MKQYIKPTVEVVELAVRENIAALPAALSVTSESVTIGSASETVILTTYNLAAAQTSNPSQV